MNFSPINAPKIITGESPTSKTIPNLIIGNDPMDAGNCHWNGYIFEVINYDTVLNKAQINQVENYLHSKYAPKVNLGPDISINSGFCDTTIRAGSCYLKYSWSKFDSVNNSWSVIDSLHDSLSVSNTGKFAVHTLDVFGAWSSDTISVKFPTISYPPKVLPLCKGGTVTWNTRLVNSQYTFLWQDSIVSDSAYSISSSGNYFVKISDHRNCSLQSDTISVILDAFKDSTSLGPKVSICKGARIKLVQGAALVQAYSWSPGGSTQSSIAILDSGMYYLTVTDINSCMALDSIDIAIKGVAPIVGFSITNTKYCQSDSVKFINLSKDTVPGDSIKSWFWNFGDLTTDTTKNPSHLYKSKSDTGTFSVYLMITSSSGCSNTSPDSIIHVYPKPYVDFSSPFLLCTGYATKFTPIDSLFGYSVQSYYWNFGSGKGDTSQLPVSQKIFSTPGTFKVKLAITSNHGCISDTAFHTFTVNPSPIASFTTTLPCAGREVIITDKSTSVSPIQDHEVLFGDNTSPLFVTNVNNLTHTYTNSGLDSLLIIDSAFNGCVDTFKTVLTVHSLPIDTFTVTGTPFCLNSGVNFNSLAYIFPPDTIVNWNWIFDGTKSIGGKSYSTVINQFSTPGVHTAFLIATSSTGCLDSSRIQSFSILPLPNAAFTYSSTEINPPLTVKFYPSFESSKNTYLWNFGAGNHSSLANPSVNYSASDTGLHKVLLTLMDSAGCSDTSSQHFDINFAQYDVTLCPVTATVDAYGFLSVYVTFQNRSNRPLTNLSFVVDVDGDPGFIEQWNGSLGVGNTLVNYELLTQPRLSSTSEHSYVCVTAVYPDGSADSDPSNNTCCATLNNNAFSLPNPSPNPVSGNITIPFIIPADGLVQINLFNNLGQKMMETIQFPAIKGYNSVTYYAGNLPQGVYLYQVDYGTSQAVKKFVKTNIQ